MNSQILYRHLYRQTGFLLICIKITNPATDVVTGFSLVAEAGFEPVPKPYIFAYIPPFQAFV